MILFPIYSYSVNIAMTNKTGGDYVISLHEEHTNLRFKSDRTIRINNDQTIIFATVMDEIFYPYVITIQRLDKKDEVDDVVGRKEIAIPYIVDMARGEISETGKIIPKEMASLAYKFSGLITDLVYTIDVDLYKTYKQSGDTLEIILTKIGDDKFALQSGVS